MHEKHHVLIKFCREVHEENSLAVAYLYCSVEKIKGAGCLTKLWSDAFPEGIPYRSWIFLHKRFANLETMSPSNIGEEMLKIKLK